jgi:UDP-2,3-diacylglucosamine pyrophosphatase LpxH
LRHAGTRIHFVGGNHDIWAARYFHERFGTSPSGGPLQLTLGSTRIHCVHGDGMLGKDLLYRGFRGLVRNPAAVRLAKALHPEALYAFSTWLSGASRAANRDEADGIEAKAARHLARCLKSPTAGPDWDVLVMGHVHHAFRVTQGSHTLLSLGGWLTPLNYGVLRDGMVAHAVFEPAAARGASS